MEKEIEYKGCKIKIVQDDYAENPFTNWDGEGKIVFHPKAGYECNTDITYEDAKETKFAVALSAYIHSGIALSVLYEGYRCQFDTSDYIAYWIPDQINNPVKSMITAKKFARQACELFNQYANGEVYGYIVEDNAGNTIDSCFGFYGYKAIDEAVEQTKTTIDNYLEGSKRIVKECIA